MTLNDPYEADAISNLVVKSERTVVRLPSFTHFACDSVFIFDLGRDLEISMFRIDPCPNTTRKVIDGQSEGLQVQVDPQDIEVGRARISPSCAAQLAMSILSTLAEKGVLQSAAVRENIDAMMTEMDAKTTVATGDE